MVSGRYGHWSCVKTCFHALSAMRSFMLNLQSFTSASGSSGCSPSSPSPSTSMLSSGTDTFSFSRILSRKKQLQQAVTRHTDEQQGPRILLYDYRKQTNKQKLEGETRPGSDDVIPHIHGIHFGIRVACSPATY